MTRKNLLPLFDNHKMAAMLTKITRDPYDWQHLPTIKPKFKKDNTVFQFDVTSSQDEEKKKQDIASSAKDSTVVAKSGTQLKKETKTGSEKETTWLYRHHPGEQRRKPEPLQVVPQLRLR